MRLCGKVTLITGGATGIGAACARRFADEGAHVVIADINEQAGRRTAEVCGGRFVTTDIGNAEQCRAAVEETVACYGRLDILVNTAAHLGGYHDAAAMTLEEWHAVLAVTLDGVFYCSKYAVQEMLKTGGGAIVIIASVEGMMGAAGHAAYVTAKSALFGLTRSLAIDFGKSGVRVNAISPGIIDSGQPDIERLKHDPDIMRFWRDMTVLDRMGRPEEVAAAALFLASDEASYITGQNLAVDGGWTIGHPPLPRSFQ
ncbi:SDR family NAD(P)-dependent oxidoreductase [Roseiflexus castenholzii]|jgi:NAD(P)-dependent dehydrogenase (short-subunit alcohol dehydrogenase family)|uniref:Short-chain dehydrogenase/reductase SDR n=1 Tax=Roseiflexus castenholzii (strain DSM 13941 / HLO8) TaxID=383372 RepID=A7NQP2_ROSCS|nr:SDR family NAD(P)-dependent oxidoreductase [Roseiflexus castenholzii]ABU59888.1 short-chain dehydrogenase/reductase SDR [Roseiflexus castenholzii DSM 13941]